MDSKLYGINGILVKDDAVEGECKRGIRTRQ